MATINNEATGSRKKYLVPLVVLMLCAVSLAGAGYAYSSNISGNDDVQTAYYNVTFGDNGFDITDKLKFDSEVTWNKDTKEETVQYSLSKDEGCNIFKFGLLMGKNDSNGTDGFIILSATVKCVYKGENDAEVGLDGFTYDLTATVNTAKNGYDVEIKVTGATIGENKTPLDSYTFIIDVKTSASVNSTVESPAYADYSHSTTVKS